MRLPKNDKIIKIQILLIFFTNIHIHNLYSNSVVLIMTMRLEKPLDQMTVHLSSYYMLTQV